MRDALAATRRPIVFSICEWGVQGMFTVDPYCHLADSWWGKILLGGQRVPSAIRKQHFTVSNGLKPTPFSDGEFRELDHS